jgi:endonuclease/exonuclease/phosphatase family metal-dependent hydrolase
MSANLQRKFKIPYLRSVGRRYLYEPQKKLARLLNAVKSPTRNLITLTVPANNQRIQKCQPITVVSANLWHDWPRYRQLPERLIAFAKMIESHRADIMLLQEVARTTRFRVDEWLAERLGMGYAYARANGDESGVGFEEGLAVFSRFPLENPQSHQLGVSAFQLSRRMALGVEVKTPCGDLKVFSVHLGLADKANRAQVRRLRNWIRIKTMVQTALIGGDFNAHEIRGQIRDLQNEWMDLYRYKYPEQDGTTHELKWPWGKPMRRQRLDYIFMQNGVLPWRVLDAKHIGPKIQHGSHSDHRAVLVTLMPILSNFNHFIT